ncbi:pyridoxal phosphate-dependent aminotransferase [Oscillatoria sp. HE19RPO]|uniref:pyridoxal phosphate-dependent aminotransferase n=1 Tax=Oscillatoria sp. HE19RPO TaxID=2954806 RepID=UPI0020C4E6F5|nr:pyridoxal phosphate-dependent aminotransferase [Oscillatoria sp. HE19RPO]
MNEYYCSYPSLAMDVVMEAFETTEHQGFEPINLGKGMSSFNPFDRVNVQLSNTLLKDYIGYGDINGMMDLRLAICRYYQDWYNYDLTPDRVCITDGASGALTIALAMLLKPGGEVILPESCYPAYKVMVEILNGTCCLVPMKGCAIDLEALPQYISSQTQAIIINSPSNPYGAFLGQEELEAIASLGVPVIFDEVYQSLPLTDQFIPSAISYCDRHLIVNSLSKSLAIAGFRVGYLIVPEAQVKLMTNVKAVLNMCTSLPSQIIAAKLMPHWDLLVNQHCRMLRQNWDLFKQTAQDLGLSLRTHPQVGFFALVDVTKAEESAMALSLDLAQNHALCSTPGVDFHQSDNAFLRLNFACPSHHIEIGLSRLANYLMNAQFVANPSSITPRKSLPARSDRTYSASRCYEVQ